MQEGEDYREEEDRGGDYKKEDYKESQQYYKESQQQGRTQKRSEDYISSQSFSMNSSTVSDSSNTSDSSNSSLNSFSSSSPCGDPHSDDSPTVDFQSMRKSSSDNTFFADSMVSNADGVNASDNTRDFANNLDDDAENLEDDDDDNNNVDDADDISEDDHNDRNDKKDEKTSGPVYYVKYGWRKVRSWVDLLSLSTRLIIILTVLLALGLTALAFTTQRLMWAYMVGRIDEELTHQSQFALNDINSLTRQGELGAPTNYFLQIRNAQNQIINTPLIPMSRDGIKSMPELPPNGQAGNLPFDTPETLPAKAIIVATDTKISSRFIPSEARAPWRVIKLQWIQTGTNQSGVFYFGLSLSDIMDVTSTIMKYFIFVSLFIIILSVLLGLLVIEYALRPLKRIEKCAAQIAAGDLSIRLPSLPERTEIGSLSHSLNVMLARIEKSFAEEEAVNAKMRRFVSDASHELRTPLATIHGYAELYQMQREAPGAVERADETIERIERSATRMTALVQNLLSLARLDEGRGIQTLEPVNVVEGVRDALEDMHALDPNRPIQLGVQELEFPHKKMLGRRKDQKTCPEMHFIEGDPAPIMMMVDPSKLRQVFTNIVGNIHRYTPADSLVEVAVTMMSSSVSCHDISKFAHSGGFEEFMQTVVPIELDSNDNSKYSQYAVIQFIDHGPGVKTEALPHIFERFYTADESRAREKGGTGLGMAIAHAVIFAHNGIITASPTKKGGLTINIVLPITVPRTEGRVGEAGSSFNREIHT